MTGDSATRKAPWAAGVFNSPIPTDLSPVASAGNDLVVLQNTLVTLDASSSYDPNNEPYTVEWTQISGISVTLSSINSETPNFTAPIINSSFEVLVFELTVTDNNGNSDSDQVEIMVLKN